MRKIFQARRCPSSGEKGELARCGELRKPFPEPRRHPFRLNTASPLACEAYAVFDVSNHSIIDLSLPCFADEAWIAKFFRQTTPFAQNENNTCVIIAIMLNPAHQR
jgi:hypothetical protein